MRDFHAEDVAMLGVMGGKVLIITMPFASVTSNTASTAKVTSIGRPGCSRGCRP